MSAAAWLEAADAPIAFAEPWHARAFALVIALSRAGVFTRAEFQAALIAEIGTTEASGCIVDEADYYNHWLEALEGMLEARQIGGLAGGAASFDARIAALADAAGAVRAHQHHASRDADGRLRVAPIVVA